MAIPELECDLVMKGGVTSGIVYPEAVLKLASKYRFRNIGGTSAGGIAAAITAAAEFNREGGGLEEIRTTSEELTKYLPRLFQPSPKLKPLFKLLIDIKENNNGFGGLFFKLISSLMWNGILGRGHINALKKKVPENFYGICTGATQPGYEPNSGLTDWLAVQIETAAGRMDRKGAFPARPLLFGDLWMGRELTEDELADGAPDPVFPTKQIDLKMMTTCASMRRPYTLPELDDDGNLYFKPDEMAQLFPDFVVHWLARGGKAFDHDAAYRTLPTGWRMPVILAVRMSLSFPLLFSAIPLHRVEHRIDPKVQKPLWFSDGGLTSNFPIHFFDSYLPSRPTFGLSLDPFDERFPDNRIYMPFAPSQGLSLTIGEISGLPGFMGALLNASKDWQDLLQSRLTGFRERIVHIQLNNKEGGLNLHMDADTKAFLTQLGGKAGDKILNGPEGQGFDFDDHRWRRFLVLFENIEQMMISMEGRWDGDTISFKKFLEAYVENPKHHNSSSLATRKQAIERIDALMTAAAGWKDDPLSEKLHVPAPNSSLRVRPRY